MARTPRRAELLRRTVFGVRGRRLAMAALYSYSWPSPIHSRSTPKNLPLPGRVRSPCTKQHIHSVPENSPPGPCFRDNPPSSEAGGRHTPAAGPPSKRILITQNPSALSSLLPGRMARTCPAPPVARRRPSHCLAVWTLAPVGPLLLKPLSLTAAFPIERISDQGISHPGVRKTARHSRH